MRVRAVAAAPAAAAAAEVVQATAAIKREEHKRRGAHEPVPRNLRGARSLPGVPWWEARNPREAA